MKITVILSVHNGEKFIQESVESILSQTFTDFEFLVINDASSDKTADILRGFSDGRIRIITNDKNLGLTKCLNLGLREAKGEYIARMDADDVASPDRLTKQLEFMEANPDIALIGSAVDIINGKGDIIGHKDRLTKNLAIKYYSVFIDNPFIHSTLFFRKKAIQDAGGYDESFRYAQDYELASRLLKQGLRLANLPDRLLRLRKHSAAISRSPESSPEQAGARDKIKFQNHKRYLDISWHDFLLLDANYRKRKVKLSQLPKTLKLNKKLFKFYLAKEGIEGKEKRRLRKMQRKEQFKKIRYTLFK
jgi:glycosyltransferase involved in cell wall biosynthesis